MTKHSGGCRRAFFGLAILLVLVVSCVIWTGKRAAQWERAERERLTSMTPEQRNAEAERKAAQQAEEDSKRKSDEEKRSAEAERTRLESEAYTFARDYVKQFLSFPHDAKFPWLDYNVNGNPETGVYWVSSTVKAKNALGAELTYEWKAQLNLEGREWSLAFCQVGDDVVYLDEQTQEAMAKLAEALANPRKEEGPISQPSKPPPKTAKRRALPERKEFEFKVWTDSTGEHQIEARLLQYVAGTATLEKRDGSKVEVPVERLSNEDRDWIDKQK
ncbi:MAG: SHD1 domain-containing protein [Planctomycetota bacterium]